MTRDFRELIHVVPDFPKPGISFKDITPLLADGPAFADCIDRLATATWWRPPNRAASSSEFPSR
jgi:adenine/guanine phosphoribosyltransferase-like PRPP-binding protein